MSLNYSKSVIPKPYPGEALSSWMFRVRELVPQPALHALRNSISYDKVTISNQHERDETLDALKTPYLPSSYFTHKPCDDLDLCFDGEEIQAFVKAYALSVSWLKRIFAAPDAPIIPVAYRRGYCYMCMEEAISATGFPVYLKCWRFLLQPYCIRHCSLLRDGNDLLFERIDFGRKLFQQHWEQHREQLLIERIDEENRHVLALGLRVQKRLQKLLKECKDSDVRHDMLSFVTTLMRITFLPSLRFCFDDTKDITVQGFDEGRIDRFNNIMDFYHTVRRSTSAARGRSFYLIGLMLGWINDAEAKRARIAHCYFLPTSPELIWARLNRSTGASQTKLMLKLFSTKDLSMSMLKGGQEC